MGRMKELFIDELERELMTYEDVYLDNAWHYAKWKKLKEMEEEEIFQILTQAH